MPRAGAPCRAWALSRNRSRQLFQIAEHGGAGLRHRIVRSVAAWQRRPPALLDEGALLIRRGLLQISEVLLGVRRVLELLDADRSERRRHRGLRRLVDHLGGVSARRPTGPA